MGRNDPPSQKATNKLPTALGRLLSVVQPGAPDEGPQVQPETPKVAPLKEQADIAVDSAWEASERFPSCLFITDPVLSNEVENYDIKQVVFTIESHDQGWTSEDNYNTEYEGSWTWFEVAILRQGADIPPWDQHSIDSQSCIKDYLNKLQISTPLNFVIHTERDTPFWQLQRNRRGKDEPNVHEIVWNKTRPASDSELLGWDFDVVDGSGSGIGFVESLDKNDRVVVIARAKKPESVNYILKAEIKIEFGGPKPNKADPHSENTPDAPNLDTTKTPTRQASVTPPPAKAPRNGEINGGPTRPQGTPEKYGPSANLNDPEFATRPTQVTDPPVRRGSDSPGANKAQSTSLWGKVPRVINNRFKRKEKSKHTDKGYY